MPDWNQRARILIDLGRHAEAITVLLEALQESPGNAFTYSQLAYCHAVLGNKDLALAAAHEAVRLAPNQGYAHYSLAICFFHAKAPVLAQVAIVTALHLDPADCGTLHLAARIALLHANREAAGHLLDAALRLDPTLQTARNLKVEILLQEGKKEEAKILNEGTLRLYPEDPYAVEVHGWLLKQSGQSREAEERYDEALRLNPLSQSSKDAKIKLLKERNKIAKWLLSFERRFERKVVLYLLFMAYSILLLVSYLFGEIGSFKILGVFAAQWFLVILVLTQFSGPLSDLFSNSSKLPQLQDGEILQGRWIASLLIWALLASPLIWVLHGDLKLMGAIAFVAPLNFTFLVKGFFCCNSPIKTLALRMSTFVMGLFGLVGALMIAWPAVISSPNGDGPYWIQSTLGLAIHQAGLIIWSVLPLLALVVGYLADDVT